MFIIANKFQQIFFFVSWIVKLMIVLEMLQMKVEERGANILDQNQTTTTNYVSGMDQYCVIC